MARYLIQIIVVGSQVVGRAFARALRQEFQSSQHAARQAGSKEAGTSRAAANAKLGLTLQEAMQILNAGEKLDPERAENHYKHLFEVNDKSKGGSFYLQSKIPQQCFKGVFAHQQRCYSTVSTEHVFGAANRIRCMEKLKTVRISHISEERMKKSKNAAVLVSMCRIEGRPSVLVTRRSMTVGRNGGDLSFPGGMHDAKADKDWIATALREGDEEIGLDRASVDVWGHGPPILDYVGSMVIHPIVCDLGDVDGREWRIQAGEVEEIVIFDMGSMCDANYQRHTYFRHYYWPYPVFLHPKDPTNCRIWGLTAIITHFTLEALLPGTYKRFIRPLKVVRAKERIDEELQQQQQSAQKGPAPDEHQKPS